MEFKLNIIPYTITAVILQENKGLNRRYWLAYWIGTMFGPLLMAITNAKTIYFGEQKPGYPFRFIRIEWR